MDKQVQVRNITVYRQEDPCTGSMKTVDAKVFYPDGTEVQATDPTPSQHFEAGKYAQDDSSKS